MDCSNSIILSSIIRIKDYFIDYNKYISWTGLNYCLSTYRNYNDCVQKVNTFLYPNGYVKDVMFYQLTDEDELKAYDFAEFDANIKKSLMDNLTCENEVKWSRIFQFFGLNRNGGNNRYYLKIEYKLPNSESSYYYVYEYDLQREIEEKIVYPIVKTEELEQFKSSTEARNEILFCTLDNNDFGDEFDKYFGPLCDFHKGKIPLRFVIGNKNTLNYTDLEFNEFRLTKTENRDDYLKV